MWPFKRKPKRNICSDQVIASAMMEHPIRRLGGSDLFTIGDVIYKFREDSIVRQDGHVIWLSPAAVLFLAAHIASQPAHTIN